MVGVWKRGKRIKCRLVKTLEVDGAGNLRGTVQASLQIHTGQEKKYTLDTLNSTGNALQQKAVELGWLKPSVVRHSTSQIVSFSHLKIVLIKIIFEV